MPSRNTILWSIVVLSMAFSACEKENELDELEIKFKTEAGYISSDATLQDGTSIVIGIEAETKKARDPIIRFAITETRNGANDMTVYTEDLETTGYEYDYSFTVGGTSGDVLEYTFTITNRDGISAQKSLRITVE